MSKHFTRLFNPHADTGPGRDGAPLLPDETIQPREAPGAMPSMRGPTAVTREQLREAHGESMAAVAWDAEVKLRNELAATLQDLQRRLSGINDQIAAAITAGQPRLRELQAGMDRAYTMYLSASAAFEDARVAQESQLAPLRGQVEGLLRELHQPLHASRTKNWQPVPDSTGNPREH